ncbi:MAG TPA: hypothetical protein ENI33_06850 [Thermoplasmatales archaeon]|nr:hypothetical protein [Thermoplasmatales archaeon]
MTANITPKTIAVMPNLMSSLITAMIPKITASGPKTIGKITNDNIAKTIPKILYFLPSAYYPPYDY